MAPILLPYQPRQQFINGRRLRVEVKQLVLGVPELVSGQLLPQGFASLEPAGDHFMSSPAAIAESFQVYPAAEW